MKRTVSFRYKVRRNNSDYTELQAIGAPTVRMQSSGEIKTALSGEFVLNDDVDWLTDEIEPVLIIDGAEHPLGIYAVATKNDAENATTKSVNIEAYDRCWRLRDTKTEERMYFAASKPYQAAIEEMLAACGIALYQFTPTSETLGVSREWEIGTSYLTIVNELLAEINYGQIYFNSEGVAIIQPEPEISAENITHTLDSSNVNSLLLPEIEREMDIYNTPNVFIAICSSADRASPLVATAINDNPQSPLSTMRRGRRIVNVERVNNIASQSALQEYVNIKRSKSMMAGELVTVSTGLLPGFSAQEVVGLIYGDYMGICREKGWTMELQAGGTMTHELEKVVVALE